MRLARRLQDRALCGSMATTSLGKAITAGTPDIGTGHPILEPTTCTRIGIITPTAGICTRAIGPTKIMIRTIGITATGTTITRPSNKVSATQAKPGLKRLGFVFCAQGAMLNAFVSGRFVGVPRMNDHGFFVRAAKTETCRAFAMLVFGILLLRGGSPPQGECNL